MQAIVRIANRLKIPIYTISIGHNLTYGGSAPVYPGSAVLDLKRMNRIIEVNERSTTVWSNRACRSSSFWPTSARRA